LEVFLIRLRRNTEVVPKNERYSYKIGGVEVSREVKEILDILKENLYGRITVTDVAAKTFKSISTVNNIFSTYQKGGIIRYFNYLKIEEAKRLIRETELSFAQIAEQLAFDTPQYFSRCFRVFAGQSPQDYKRALKEYTPPVSNQTPIGSSHLSEEPV
jgi:AraC-like DNA-binding protein